MATVKERGYRHWDGRLVERRFPWLPIARTGVRLAFRKKGFKFAFAAAFSPATVFLGLLYISERIEDFKALVRTNQNLLNVSPNYFKTFLTSGPFLFLLVLVLVFASAGLIAEDLKHSSLQLYFARPLKKRDYLIGKLAVIAFFVLIITALPWVLLVVFKLIFAGNFKFIAAYPWLPLSILGYAVLLTVFLGFYLLLMSASGRSTRYVTVLIFFVYYFSGRSGPLDQGDLQDPLCLPGIHPGQSPAGRGGPLRPEAAPALFAGLVVPGPGRDLRPLGGSS